MPTNSIRSILQTRVLSVLAWDPQNAFQIYLAVSSDVSEIIHPSYPAINRALQSLQKRGLVHIGERNGYTEYSATISGVKLLERQRGTARALTST